MTDTPGGTPRKAQEGEYILIRDALPAIIDRATWDRWKELSSARRFEVRTSVERPVQFLLSRLIKCGSCGGNYVGRQNKYQTRRGETRHRIQYNCSNYQIKGPEVCPSYPIKADLIEGIVIRLLRVRLCTPAALGELESLVRERVSARRKEVDRDPKSLQRRLEELDRKIALYYKAIGDGLDTAICLSHIRDLNDQNGQLQKELEAVQDGDLYERVLERSMAEIRRIGSKFDAGFHDLPFGVQRRLILHFVDSMEVQDHSRLLIRLRVPADTSESRLLAEAKGDEEGEEVDRAVRVVQSGAAGVPALPNRKNNSGHRTSGAKAM
jgi:hypothetical protein